MNRKDILLQDLINNNSYIQKLTFCGIEKCKMLCKRLTFIKQNPNLKNKQICIDICKDRIAKKFFTLAYLNYPLDRAQAIKFQLSSLKFKFNKKNIVFLFKILLKNKVESLNISKTDLYIS